MNELIELLGSDIESITVYGDGYTASVESWNGEFVNDYSDEWRILEWRAIVKRPQRVPRAYKHDPEILLDEEYTNYEDACAAVFRTIKEDRR